jgi:hypothetical protein
LSFSLGGIHCLHHLCMLWSLQSNYCRMTLFWTTYTLLPPMLVSHHNLDNEFNSSRGTDNIEYEHKSVRIDSRTEDDM